MFLPTIASFIFLKMLKHLRTALGLRHAIGNTVILDFLDLADMTSKGATVRIDDLQVRWQCKHRTQVTTRMAAVKDAGLIDYDRARGGCYELTRLGLPSED